MDKADSLSEKANGLSKSGNKDSKKDNTAAQEAHYAAARAHAEEAKAEKDDMNEKRKHLALQVEHEKKAHKHFLLSGKAKSAMEATTDKGEEKQWGKGEWQTYKQEHHDTKVRPKFNHPKPHKPPTASITAELIAIAAELVDKDGKPLQSADNDKALAMLKDSSKVQLGMTTHLRAVTEELQHATKEIYGLEKMGSAGIEAPKLLKNVRTKLIAYIKFLNDMEDEMNKAL